MTDQLPATRIKFISQDFPVSDFKNPLWRQSEAVALNRLWSGEAAADSRHAAARLLWSETALYVRFDCSQKEPLVLNENPQTDAKTMQLWERDVCELFVAPDRVEPRRYVELEIAPTGEWLDLRLDWRDDEPRDWEYHSGMAPAAQIEKDRVNLAMRVPWNAFDGRPRSGDVWLGNLFRQVGAGGSRGYLAWSPTYTPEPQFHVPEKFGEFVFVD